MRTWKRFVATVSVLTIPLAMAGRETAAYQSREIQALARDYRLFDALNECVQERFRTVDNRLFGYSRMASVRTIPHTFETQNIRETSAVRDLEQAQLRVVMYLAGRGVLREDNPASSGTLLGKPSVRGPVVVTMLANRSSASGLAAFPAPLDLVPESRNALLAFSDGESTEFEQGGWKFIARPVRATDASCLSCHRGAFSDAPGDSLRLGDALGTVLYGYQRQENQR